ncbi:GNAT family N-acetyltransferase [Kitasatospora sp. CB01950]|uniref:GNAT family N-acetyltransferase n=1 Tax=Kitasatospora sp. CB01950 TaxID=1703930 RepID=UPI000938A30C|nr:GNAT family N-acetyltransferase [Kitasatospora sp. CB01950]OKI99148.1 acetyltransferase [Kitasatospora sp. CB01950]
MAQAVLPEGWTARALEPATDLYAVQQLVNACERALGGTAVSDSGAIATVLARPGLDPVTDTLLVHAPDGELAAWAWTDRRTDADVHPAHRGRGIGTAMLRWIEERARERGTAELAQIVPDRDTAATALLRARGFRADATSWLLAIDLDDLPHALPPAPEGITVRPFRAGDAADERAAHRLVEDAFDEWQQRRKDFDEWAAHTVRRDSFAAERSPLAFADGHLVGAALSLGLPATGEGYVENVAVHAAHRHRGIARHLLRHTFHACRDAGLRSCTLWTHSATGALDLYLKAGMTVRHSSTVLKKTLQ